MKRTFLRAALPLVCLCGLAPAQTLYVSDFGIHRFNGNTGASLGTFAIAGDTTTGFAFGPDGNLYVAGLSLGQVMRFNGVTGDFMDVFVAGLTSPFGLTFGPDGNLYVADSATHQVLRFNGSSGAFIDVFANGGGLNSPSDLVFGPDGNLYVTSTFSNEVLRYNGASGAFMGVFASGGGLDWPLGLTFGPDGHLYVSSYLTAEVLKFDGVTGAFIAVFATGYSFPGPLGIAFGPDGNLYAANRETGSVYRHNGVTGAFMDVFVDGLAGATTFLLFRGAAGPIAADAPFQVRYVANLNVVDSLINITNTGANGAMPFGPGIGPQAGNLCVNVYAFSPDEQMVGCCSCHVTPNGLASLSVYNDIRAITLTGLTPNSMMIKLVATGTGIGHREPVFTGGASSCSQSAAGLNLTHPVAPGGLSAWATTGHVPGAFPVPGAPAPFAITETSFTPATLSQAEIASLNNRCTAIIGNGSTFGTCRSCSLGGRGGVKF